MFKTWVDLVNVMKNIKDLWSWFVICICSVIMIMLEFTFSTEKIEMFALEKGNEYLYMISKLGISIELLQ
jgi:hypothetical protein